MSDDEFFARRSEPPPIPAPERPALRSTRWRATTTTFGPTVKLVVTFFLVVNPAIITIRDLLDGSLSVDTGTPISILTNIVIWAVCLWITVALWRPGRTTAPRRNRR